LPNDSILNKKLEKLSQWNQHFTSLLKMLEEAKWKCNNDWRSIIDRTNKALSREIRILLSREKRMEEAEAAE
jgi:mRNA-degrading endonuclease HigB of HigAB toxin-antitoxin module